MSNARVNTQGGVIVREEPAPIGRSDSRSGVRRVLLLAAAGFATAAAALAIAILLFGDFGETEGRILATTALLAGYSLLALPAAILQDQRRLSGLAAALGALAAVSAGLSIAAVWQNEPTETFGKVMGTANAWLVATAQIAVLVARRRTQDPRAVGRLFAASSALATILATMLSVLIWGEIDREGFARVFGALLVLDVLLVILQPILARAARGATAHRLRVVLASGETVVVTVPAPDLAGAAAAAIRAAERDGKRVLALEVADTAAGRAGDRREVAHQAGR
jgi:hypothetical protein